MDIATRDGDLALIETDQGTDLLLDSSLDIAVRRAIRTPKGYIARETIANSQLAKVDEEYGNGLYLYLSEPLDFSWVAGARQEVARALSFLSDDISIESVDVALPELSQASIAVTYRIQSQTQTVQVDLPL